MWVRVPEWKRWQCGCKCLASTVGVAAQMNEWQFKPLYE